MASKITLYSEKELIEEIKLYAKSQNSSVSKIVNEFFKNLLKVKKSKSKGDLTNKLSGKLKNRNVLIKDYERYLEEKYL